MPLEDNFVTHIYSLVSFCFHLLVCILVIKFWDIVRTLRERGGDWHGEHTVSHWKSSGAADAQEV